MTPSKRKVQVILMELIDHVTWIRRILPDFGVSTAILNTADIFRSLYTFAKPR